MPGRRRTALGAALAMVIVATGAAVLTGCGDDAAPSAFRSVATTDPPVLPGLTAVLIQYREDDVAHRLQVEIHNGTAADVRVGTMTLRWAGLQPIPSATPNYLVGHGQTVDLPLPFGDAHCPSSFDPDHPPASPIVALVQVPADGSTNPIPTSDPAPTALRPVTVPVDDVNGTLARFFHADCLRQGIAHRVDIGFGPSWTPVDGDPAHLAGTLELTRRSGNAPVVLGQVAAGGVLIDLAAAHPESADAVATLPGDQSVAHVPVVIASTNRCGPHELGESKKTYVFLLTVDVGQGPTSLTLVTPDDLKPTFYSVVTAGCRLS